MAQAIGDLPPVNGVSPQVAGSETRRRWVFVWDCNLMCGIDLFHEHGYGLAGGLDCNHEV